MVVKQVGDGRVGGVEIERRRVLPGGIAKTQVVAIGRIFEIRITGIAAVNQVAAVIYYDVINDQDASCVGRPHKVLQVRHRAPMRVHLVKITRIVAVKLAAHVQHHGRNPNCRGAERFDVIQFLLDALEVAAVNRCAAVTGGIVIAIDIVIGRVAVIKTVGQQLVDALLLPETVGGALSL